MNALKDTITHKRTTPKTHIFPSEFYISYNYGLHYDMLVHNELQTSKIHIKGYNKL
jgi:hypothetical protein